ncbi:Na+/H+ antiporter NhaA, partial [Klebsiella pneumoniae]
LLIGLEVKRELLEGALKSKETAIFPAIAAVGGILAPALIYVAFNANDPEAISGWAIPAATDIAFALGIMALLGKRVPVSLKVFLLAVA